MTDLSIPTAPPTRDVYANRTLNLRSIAAIGYDMDYTLVHYNVVEWEKMAFAQGKARLAELGWPTDGVEFDPSQVIRGLVIDVELGNLLKATRFGYVIKAAHGSRVLTYGELREAYAETFVDLSDPRFEFMNTLFSLSEASLFLQYVDRLEAGDLPHGLGHGDVYHTVREAIDRSHADGILKRQILAEPERFIDLDPDLVLALRDLRAAGRQLLLITNSEWEYANAIMAYAFDRYMPEGQTWRDLFSCVIVSASKPAFFTGDNPLYKVVDEERALLRPHLGAIEPGSVFFGGNARIVEQSLGLSGDQILYVGDHIFGDVHFSKALLRWRTALILRELESEIAALIEFLPKQRQLETMMATKERLEAQVASLRLAALRGREGYAPPPVQVPDPQAELERVRTKLAALDDEIAPLAIEASRLRNETWGPLMRAGIDKSLFARQVERYADIYTSRVSNFLYPGPFALFRTGRLDLPHDVKLRRD